MVGSVYIVLALAARHAIAAHHETCGDVKGMYKEQGCCGNPAKDFDFTHYDVQYAFSLVTLDTSLTTSFPVPDDKCFKPVTLPGLLATDHVEYSWVPWSKVPEADISTAPSGAYVYKMKDGSIIYKKIGAVAVDSPDAALKFGKAQHFTKAKTFAEVTALGASADPIITELQLAIECFGSDLSLTVEPFVNYAKFVWAAGPFSMAGPNDDCGSYVYELKDGSGIVYHSC